MSKFQNMLAEAAYFIAGNGFSVYEEGSVEELDGWNALVTVSMPVLLNLGMDEYSLSQVLKEFPEARSGEVLVWVQEDSQGFVNILGTGDQVESDWTRLYNYEKV